MELNVSFIITSLFQVYNHFTIKVSLQYVASIRLNEHESTGRPSEDKLKDGRTKAIILPFAARVQTRLCLLQEVKDSVLG